MFNITKKKTIIGIVGIVLSIVLAAVCGGFDVGGSIDSLTAGQKVIRFFCVSGIALTVGFLALIFFDWKMLLFASVAMETMVSLQFITAVNVSVGMIFISLLAFGICTFWFTTEFRVYRYKINGAIGVRQQQKEREQIRANEEITAADDQLKRSIKYGEKSILISSQMGAAFQVIKSEREYYFHYIGNILTKLDESKLITDLDDVESFAHKKDFRLNAADIVSLNLTLRNAVQFMDCGTLKIKTSDGKTKSYGLLCGLEEEEIKSFFGEGIVIDNKMKPVEADEVAIDDSRKKVLNKFNLARYIFSIVSVIIFIVYTFYNSEKTDPYFTALAVIVCLVPTVTYFIFQDYLTIRDEGRFSKRVSDKLNITATVVLFPIFFALKCLLTSYSMAYYQLPKLLLYSLIPLAVGLIVFFVFDKEYKKFKSCILVFALALIAFCPSFIYKVNIAFDFKQPEVVACEVIELSADTAKNGKVDYNLVFSYEGRKIEVEVDELLYNELTVGGEVNVLRYRGLFGIQTVYLD